MAQKQAAEVMAGEVKSMYPELYKALSRDLDVKVKDLKAYIQSEFKVTSSGKGQVTNNYYTTSTDVRRKYQQFTAGDGYLSIKADLIDSLNAPYTYTYTDTIKQSISVKRKWLLGKEYLYGSAAISNPNAKIIGSQNILIKDYRDKRWGLGVGAIYDPFTSRASVGISFSYILVKF